ncbi:hypothetical protein SARC_18209, partial [Sphaeroforma arctica JP610]
LKYSQYLIVSLLPFFYASLTRVVFSEIFDDLSAITRYLPDPDLGPVLVFITRAAQKTNVDS